MATKNNFSERAKAQVLLACSKSVTIGQLRSTLKSIGFTQVSAVSTHVAALERAKSRNFNYYFFDAKDSDMPALEFVTAIVDLEPNAIMIAVSEEPRIDDVFGLLRAGARSFLVPPFNTNTVEDIVISASEGPPLSEAVLNAPDRNAAFVAVILNNLYRLSVSMRQAREFKTAQRDVTTYTYALREALEMAQLFCEGGDDDLRDKIVEGCINRAKDAATRLGRLRKKLRRDRFSDGDEAEEEEGVFSEKLMR